MCNSIIYIGKRTVLNTNYKNLPISSQVVLMLMHTLLDKGFCATIGNFYTSMQLADILVLHKTDMLLKLKKVKLMNGEILAFQREKVRAIKKDKKDLALLTTIHNTEMKEISSKIGMKKKKTVVVISYNDIMGGVDRIDQKLSSYPIAIEAKNIIRKLSSI